MKLRGDPVSPWYRLCFLFKLQKYSTHFLKVDITKLNWYRPISNVLLCSKIMERMVNSRSCYCKSTWRLGSVQIHWLDFRALFISVYSVSNLVPLLLVLILLQKVFHKHPLLTPFYFPFILVFLWQLVTPQFTSKQMI